MNEEARRNEQVGRTVASVEKELILDTIRKWLGADVFNVTVHESLSKLSVTYRDEYTSRSTAARPNPPVVHYIIVTTCPSTVKGPSTS